MGSISIRRLDERRTGTEFFDRTQTDAVGLAKGAVDGSCLGDAHLGTTDEGRDVRGISISISDEAARAGAFVDGGLEDPAVGARITYAILKSRSNSLAFSAQRDSEKARVRNIPISIYNQNFSVANAESQCLRELAESNETSGCDPGIMQLDEV
jgi:hypothetical protein